MPALTTGGNVHSDTDSMVSVSSSAVPAMDSVSSSAESAMDSGKCSIKTVIIHKYE